MLEEDLALRLIQFAAVIDVMVLERFPSFDREFVVEGFLHALSKACVIGGVAGFVAASVWEGINNCWWGTDCKRTFRERLRVCKDMTIDNGYC